MYLLSPCLMLILLHSSKYEVIRYDLGATPQLYVHFTPIFELIFLFFHSCINTYILLFFFFLDLT